MREIQNADGIGPMQVDEVLEPDCSISNRAHALSLPHPPSSDFPLRELLKGVRISHARKIGQMAHFHVLVALCAGVRLDISNSHRAYFGPFPCDQGHIGSVTADGLFERNGQGLLFWFIWLTCGRLRLWFGLLTVSRLHLLIVRSCLLGHPTHCGFAHLDPQQTLQHLSSLRKRHPDCQMNQMFMLRRGQTAWQQS